MAVPEGALDRRAALLTYGAVAALTCVTLGLGAFDLGARSIWLDEGASYAIASQHGSAFFSAVAHDGGNLAAYYLLLHGVILLFGSGTIVLRLPALLAAAAAVPLTFAIGAKLMRRRVGLMGAALLSVSLPLIYWGQMARGYTLGTALSAASCLAFICAVRSGRRRCLVWWVLFSVLLCYTLLEGALLVVAQLVTLLLPGTEPTGRRRLLLSTPLIAFGCVPLGLMALHRGNSQLFWLARPGSATVRSALAFLSGAYYQRRESPAQGLLIALFLSMVVVALLLVVADLRAHRRAEAYGTAFVLSVAAVMPLCSYLFSLFSTPIFIDRYFAPCLPGAALVAGVVCARLRPPPLGVAACAGLCALRLGQIFPIYGLPVDDWRAASSYVLSTARPGDCVAFFANDGYVDFSYYLSHRPSSFPAAGIVPRPVLPARPFGGDPAIIEQYHTLSPAQILALRPGCDRVFMVESHDGSRIGTTASRHIRGEFLGMQAGFDRAYSQNTVAHFLNVTVHLYFGPRAVGQ